MNATQIKCFLTFADTLNIYSEKVPLYIAQPTSNRQIVLLEREVHTQLVIRAQKQEGQ